MARVLVADGEQRSAVAVIRSLGAAGHEAHVASAHPRPLAGGSRSCAGAHRTPDPLKASAEFADRLATLCRELRADVVIPVTEASVLAVLEHSPLFEGTVVPFPRLETYRAASRKDRVRELATEAGFAVPDQWVLESPGALADLEVGTVRFPVALKSASTVVIRDGTRHTTGVAYADGPDELTRRVRSLPDHAFPLLVQRRIVGPGIGIFVLIWNDRLVAHFGHRRIREKPPSGGVSVLRESVPVDPALLERAVELFRKVEWRGVAMLECKMDEADGTPYVLEVNGRFWGSLQLAVDAGVDFPRLLVEAATGREPEPVGTYRTGVLCRWLWGDTDQLLIRLRRSGGDPALPPGGPGRLRSLATYLGGFRPGVKAELLRVRDPGPFLRETGQWLRAVSRRRPQP